jgi:hypothetical protein
MPGGGALVRVPTGRIRWSRCCPIVGGRRSSATPSGPLGRPCPSHISAADLLDGRTQRDRETTAGPSPRCRRGCRPAVREIFRRSGVIRSMCGAVVQTMAVISKSRARRSGALRANRMVCSSCLSLLPGVMNPVVMLVVRAGDDPCVGLDGRPAPCSMQRRAPSPERRCFQAAVCVADLAHAVIVPAPDWDEDGNANKPRMAARC